MIVLGLETSCDETSAAVIKNGKLESNLIYSQTEHSDFGGVVPEIASRAHLEKIAPLTQKALTEASVSAEAVDLIAVSDSPGLAGALLVGISYALGMHMAHGTALSGINHLEGHIAALFISNPDIPLPFLALVVSGGHTAIYRVDDFGCYTLLGQTVDDAAGEAFDKVGKMLGFNYPAGRSIEQKAAEAQNHDLVSFPIAKLSDSKLNFSFSGLKTAVKYFLKSKTSQYITENKADICYAFQRAVIKSLVNNLAEASKVTNIKTFGVVGGVACNSTLRKTLTSRFGEQLFCPPPSLCTDNAAMIAMAGLKRAQMNCCRFPKMNPSRGI
ncbi:tRNA (adenosine(37)-N6)-threonylcarbamoyltransferase complex transferase subunit TsaD [Chitinispirillales bacterium ANBcel5]|uniref:tRNA (adenosine(37)-N6)-threonylcarbamoyltransferase complex transferase subunit TsaD n=1 Tax=Cellulosispirillum alkaliphilum TaxID=3039283 RepID=UPI002A585B71|nr:tRNA (adenosine(37)-N6)-threonylcarbamoyltransferase complex transferase subunit TsaD [Chitinispirillales bacterium ANBcel5]